jgi:hypothetical protein
MNNEEIKSFINTYEKYYFDDVSEKDRKYGERELGVSIVNTTDRDKEKDIEEYLEKGMQDIITIEWKTGGRTDAGVLKTRFHKWPIDYVRQFCDKTNGMYLTFDDENLLQSYNSILEKAKYLPGYGSVYIISSMFFLSSGKVPIYDYYANVGVKALLYDISPQEVYVAEAPIKDAMPKNVDSKKDGNKKLAVNMLMEYKYMLRELAEGTDHFGKKGMFITRELDRALWVYGHAREKWENKRYGS